MPKSTFPTPIIIPLSDLNSSNIPFAHHSFVIKIVAYDRWGKPASTLPIAYYGNIISNSFHVNSYSYSVQLLPKHLQEVYSEDPLHTAMIGLGIVGAEINWRTK